MSIKKALKGLDLTGKTVAVTGCTGGLGKEICIYLAAHKANIIMLDRNQNKSSTLQQSITASYPSIKITRIKTDMSDFNSVKNSTKQLINHSIDIFISNAGAYSIPRYKTDIGYDNVFQINFISPYYIIRQLCENNPDIKIIAVGSIAHNYSKSDINDIDFSTRTAASKVYGNSKRYLIFSLYDCVKTENLSIVHPGITFTNITAHYPKLIFAVIKYPMQVIFPSPKTAAQCITAGLIKNTPQGYWIGPKIFNIWGAPKINKLKTCKKSEATVISKSADKIYCILNKKS